MKKQIKIILPVVFLVLGMLLFLYPDYKQWKQKNQSDHIVEQYKKMEQITESQESQEEKTRLDATEKDTLERLRLEMEDYNDNLIENGQKLVDCWSYESNPISLQHMPDNSDTIGKISIPDMDVEMLLLLGASAENMSRGAAVLAETSMPIGGKSTNCVIAGHRGYRGVPFFRNIQDLHEGSRVYIENPWEKLIYVVVKTEVIMPDDLECMEIQPDKDMVTLLTCHPYMGGGKYRYVVYCVREGTEEKYDNAGNNFDYADKNVIDREESDRQDLYSNRMILLETGIRYALAVFFILWWILLIARWSRQKRKRRSD